ncbi:hypothetical protein K8369_42810 [Streptomyces sp. PSKA30]|nr:hypothetical protein [Streptomyces sp. PSKA30]
MARRPGRLALADLGLCPGDLHRFLDEIRSEGRDLAQLLTLVGLGGSPPLPPASVAAPYPPSGIVDRPVPITALTPRLRRWIGMAREEYASSCPRRMRRRERSEKRDRFAAPAVMLPQVVGCRGSSLFLRSRTCVGLGHDDTP